MAATSPIPEDVRTLLRRCLHAHRNAARLKFMGFTWDEAGIRPQVLNKLVEQGFLEVAYSSNRRTFYQVKPTAAEVVEDEAADRGRFLRVWIPPRLWERMSDHIKKNLPDDWDPEGSVVRSALESYLA